MTTTDRVHRIETRLRDEAADPAARAWLEPRTGLGTLAFDVLDVALSSVLMGLGTAFGAVVLTVFYIDCRVRSEGFDLVMRFERLRRRAAPRSAGGRAAPRHQAQQAQPGGRHCFYGPFPTDSRHLQSYR